MTIEWTSIIIDNVIGYLLDQSGLGEEIQRKLRYDPVKKTLNRALDSTYTEFKKLYPDWSSSLFDADFSKRKQGPS